MPTVLTQPAARAAGHLVSEASGYRSREAIVIASGANLAPGSVLGKVTASGKYVLLAPDATDGSQNAAAILYADATAATADVGATANVRDCEVNGNLLTWPAGITAPQKTAATTALAALGVIIRN